MWWISILKGIVKRPWIIALIGMTVLMGFQWVKIQSLQSGIINLKNEMVALENRYGTCKNNVTTTKDALDACNNESTQFQKNISLITNQLQKEKSRVVYWRDKYNNKVCYNPTTDTVIVKPDDMRILNDEKNTDAVNRINNLFKY